MKTIGTVAALAALTFATAAHAQDEATTAPAPEPAAQAEPAATEPEATAAPAEEEPKKSNPRMKDPMGSIGLSARVGMTGQGQRRHFFDNNDVGKVNGENGLNMIFGLNLGDGHGFGTDLNLDVRRYKAKTALGDVKFGDITFEPIFGGRFQLIDPLYMFIGAGPRIGYGWNDTNAVHGAGVAGFRVPVQVTYYFIPNMAAQFELGLGYDVRIGGVDDPNPLGTGSLLDITRGFVWDFSFGLRFF